MGKLMYVSSLRHKAVDKFAMQSLRQFMQRWMPENTLEQPRNQVRTDVGNPIGILGEVQEAAVDAVIVHGEKAFV